MPAKKSQMTHERFAKIVESHDWQTIDDMFKGLCRTKFFDAAFKDRAATDGMKSFIRRMVRECRARGIGNMVSVTRKGTNGRQERIFKQMALFSLADYRYCANYHRKVAHTHMHEANLFANLGTQATGTQIPLPFPNLNDE